MHLYHPTLWTKPTRWQRLMQRFFALRAVSAIVAPIARHLDTPIIRLSKGRTSLTTLLTGLPVVTLTSIGAKSGQPRSVPVVAIPMDEDGEEKVILIASNFGRKQHPAWYYNLKANPRASLTTGNFTGEYLAREASGEEREKCWQRAASLYGGYPTYRRRASHRAIGVFVLTPAIGVAPAKRGSPRGCGVAPRDRGDPQYQGSEPDRTHTSQFI